MRGLLWRLATVGVAFQMSVACAETDYAPLSFEVVDGQIIAEGVIDDTTLDLFLDVTRDNPEISTLVLWYIEGSADDDANLVFSREVRDRGFTTIVPSDGLVASGGTDLFLAGAQRILEAGACVGVHSWQGGGVEGRDLPRNDPEHAKYLDYYDEMDVVRAFYWFTLTSAAAEDMYWMNAQDAQEFAISAQDVPALGDATSCNER